MKTSITIAAVAAASLALAGTASAGDVSHFEYWKTEKNVTFTDAKTVSVSCGTDILAGSGIKVDGANRRVNDPPTNFDGVTWDANEEAHKVTFSLENNASDDEDDHNSEDNDQSDGGIPQVQVKMWATCVKDETSQHEIVSFFGWDGLMATGADQTLYLSNTNVPAFTRPFKTGQDPESGKYRRAVHVKKSFTVPAGIPAYSFAEYDVKCITTPSSLNKPHGFKALYGTPADGDNSSNLRIIGSEPHGNGWRFRVLNRTNAPSVLTRDVKVGCLRKTLTKSRNTP